jgi:hypothetical protein
LDSSKGEDSTRTDPFPYRKLDDSGERPSAHPGICETQV